MSDIINVSFEGVVDWAQVHTPQDNSRFKGPATFQVDIRLDTPAKVAEMEGFLQAHGISLEVLNPTTQSIQPRIGTNTQGVRYLRLKRKEFNSKGVRAKIAVVDAAGEDIPPNILIGNGSRAIVHGFVRPSQRGTGGVLSLSGLQVLDLVEYNKGSPDYQIHEGFRVNAPGTNKMKIEKGE